MHAITTRLDDRLIIALQLRVDGRRGCKLGLRIMQTSEQVLVCTPN